MRKCLHCLKEYSDHMAFCPECGKALSEVVNVQERFCPKCGMKNKQGVRFCENCGTPLAKAQGVETTGTPGVMPVTGTHGAQGVMPVTGAPGAQGAMPVTGIDSNRAGEPA